MVFAFKPLATTLETPSDFQEINFCLHSLGSPALPKLGTSEWLGFEKGFLTLLDVISCPRGSSPYLVSVVTCLNPHWAGLDSWTGSKLLVGQGF